MGDRTAGKFTARTAARCGGLPARTPLVRMPAGAAIAAALARGLCMGFSPPNRASEARRFRGEAP